MPLVGDETPGGTVSCIVSVESTSYDPVSRSPRPATNQLKYNHPMTTINTIEDLARILQDQPTWAEALRALLLTQELLELPARFDRFVQAQQETNRAQQETNRLIDRRLNAIEGRLDNVEGRLGNLEGGQYERTIRTKALARSQNLLGFDAPYVALNQDGLTDPRLTSAIAQAVRNGLVTRASSAEVFEADLIISAQGNRHAAIEVSLTADRDDIDRAKTRAGILAVITGGEVTPAIITARLNDVQTAQAEAKDVTIFLVPYP